MKELLKDLFTYGIPLVGFVFSIIAFKDSREAKKVTKRLNEMEEKLKQYALDTIENEQKEAKKACVDVRITKISNRNYKLKVWNSGKATAVNVNFEVEETATHIVLKENVPYEFLEPGKSFEERVLAYGDSPRKFKIITSWENEQGFVDSKEQIVTI